MSLAATIKPLIRGAEARAKRLGAALRPVARPPVGIVIERADWAIRWWGTFTAEAANALAPGTAHVTSDPASLTSGVVEFGSQYQWVEWGRHLSPRCRFVSTFFHGKPEDGPDVARHIDAFLRSEARLSKIVASAAIVQDRLRSWGVAAHKIVRIPIGVETDRFLPPTPSERAEARQRFGVASHEIVVGSFQKDGNGWGEGLEPKLIKGPDVFLAAVEKLSRHVPVFVLLSGPARGYVKQGLERLGIRYAHHYASDRDGLAKLYHALDLYLMTSREEGGPMAVMESMSAHVPVVATRVGMAPDLITDGVSGALVEVGDVDAIVSKALGIVGDAEAAASLRRAARDAVMVADWSVVGRRHLEEVWRPLLAGEA
ncbi:glycosyltransferase [Hyphomicrobium sp.]|uniref:glycosyltransferase n=1 Tax=Hyphomicrobium sp. TaxID=82 RepID=UPI0025BAF40F|nr:glycosyltransferase [Hyphomicrobium sp.]MCC7252924.1 glycosyltransferase [Hyphomicrobium sp.]